MISNNGSDNLFQRMSGSEKRHAYPQPPLLEVAESQIFSSPSGLTCFAKINSSHQLKERQASGRSFFLGPQTFIWKVGLASDFSVSTGDAESRPLQSLLRLHAGAIRLFVQLDSEAEWQDMGDCQRQTIRGHLEGTVEIIDEVNLQLPVKLPEPLWLEFGGHPDWYLIINNQEKEAFSPDAVMAAIRDAWGRPPVDLEIRRYAGDCLFAIADASGRATMSYFADNNEFASGTPQLPGPTVPTYIFPRSDSYDHEVSVGQVITQSEAFSIIENFVRTGKPVDLVPLSILFQEKERADVPDPVR